MVNGEEQRVQTSGHEVLALVRAHACEVVLRVGLQILFVIFLEEALEQILERKGAEIQILGKRHA